MTQTTPGDRPNIIFINTDQQSSTMMSCAGNPYLKTPAMDRLANEGIRFTRAYCANPVCLPSRFSFFTGRRPSTINVWENRDGREANVPTEIIETSAPRLLKAAGYEVAYGGKTHLPGDLSPETMGCENITSGKRDDLADASAEWIRQKGKEKSDAPFFLSLCFVNPHDICFMGMRDYTRSVRSEDPDLNKNEKWLLSDDSLEMSELNRALAIPEGMTEEEFFAQRCPPLPPNHQPQEDEPEAIQENVASAKFRQYMRDKWDEKTWRLHRWAYGRLTERVDGQIGKVLQALDDAGLTDNTLVVFTSDHGDHSGSHKLDQKSIPYEEAARIPFLMRWPGRIGAGRVDETHLVSNGLDLLPTLCAVAGCAWPSELEGTSLLGILDGDSTTPFRKVLPIESEVGKSVVTNRFKYIRYNGGEGSEQLMDLQDDPYETKNHLQRAELKAELAECREAWAGFFA